MRVSLTVLMFAFMASVAAQEAKGPLAQQNQASEQENEMTKLLKARVELARKAYNVIAMASEPRKGPDGSLYLGEKPQPKEIHAWSVRWLQAEQEINPKGAAKIDALEAHLKRMTKLEERVKSLLGGVLPAGTGFEAEWFRLEAELWLAQAKAKGK